ncbi:hypothetical protein F5Y17DRAFT_457835 [Xylariaceae sp. FL0594]|nr:hypothetical protein F5Y17DRAFT_457835 [Xylariaceae sp. FL0594]
MVPFLRLRHKREPTWAKALARVDFLGNTIFIGSITSVFVRADQRGHDLRLVLTAYSRAVDRRVRRLGSLPRPTRPRPSAMNLLPSVPPLIFGNRTLAFVTGGLLTKFVKFKPVHWVVFTATSIGCGLLSIFYASSLSYRHLCPSPTPATATGTFNFVRNLGFIWGHHPAVHHLRRKEAISKLSPELKMQVHHVYYATLSILWQVATGLGALAFLLVFGEKSLDLRIGLDTDFGMEEEQGKDSPIKASEVILEKACLGYVTTY